MQCPITLGTSLIWRLADTTFGAIDPVPAGEGVEPSPCARNTSIDVESLFVIFNKFITNTFLNYEETSDNKCVIRELWLQLSRLHWNRISRLISRVLEHDD